MAVSSGSTIPAFRSLWRKHSGQLTRGVLLHHNNARPHTARATEERIQELEWELLEHLPYRPDLAPSDFHLFGPLKKAPCWQVFCWWWRGWNGGAEVAEASQKASMLHVSMLVKDMSRNKWFFQVRISCVLCFIPICDLVTDSPS
jgi:hypothetical protein